MIDFMFGVGFGVAITIIALKYLCDVTFESKDNMIITFEPEEDDDREDDG